MRFSVLTMTYNRAATLHRVWDSLCAQTLRDFEWIVVDDGSEDDTLSRLEAWRAEADVPVRVLARPHQGRPAAENAGLVAARGELLVVLDSDDACVPQALESMWRLWESIPAECRRAYAGVVFRCVDQHGAPVGRSLPAVGSDPTRDELRFRHRAVGEYFEATRTDLRRAHPYPEIPGETGISPGVVSVPLGGHRVRCSNEPLRVYWRDQPGVDQITHRPGWRHPAGHRLWHERILEYQLGWFRHDPSWFLRSAVHLGRFAVLDGTGFRGQRHQLSRASARALFAVAFPIGWVVAVWDRWRRPRRRYRPGATD